MGVALPGDPTAGLVVIGDEILSGKVDDSNMRFLVAQLWELGVRLRAVHIVPDEVDVIASAVVGAHRTFDHVLTTGGVGPTHDDVTIPAIANGLGRRLVRHPELMEIIAALSAAGSQGVLARMADVPEGARLLWGEGLRFPVLAVENIYIFPGEPTIMRRKFLAIRERFRARPFHLSRIFTTCEEAEIALLMETAQTGHAGVAVGSYPAVDNPEYKVQITVQSRDPELVREVVGEITRGIPQPKLVKVL